MMEGVGGLALTFKTRIFPPGNQKLVTEIWNYFHLPVNVWYKISTPVENIFFTYHLKHTHNR